MNILFVTNKNVYPLIGGIERITYALARAFVNSTSYKCYSAYTQENYLNATTDDVFSEKLLIDSENAIPQLSEFINKHHIDFIIAQGADANVNNIMPTLRQAVGLNSKAKILFVYHNMPGLELPPTDPDVLRWRIANRKNILQNIKQLLIQSILEPLFPNYIYKTIRNKYIIPYNAADIVVLLSDSFKEKYNYFVGGDTNKYVAIPNMLSFKEEDCSVVKKEKIALMVARMEDRHKRIKLALEIWKNFMPTDWNLQIVGDGEDLTYYKLLARKWNLTNVSFEGMQNPLPYYQKASVFLMTSAFEGFPMTLMEAMQNGCVPIVFDSFGAVHDIITPNKNGFIVKNNDKNEYVQVLKQLTTDNTLLTEMQANCRKYCQVFSPENVSKQWIELFESLNN